MEEERTAYTGFASVYDLFMEEIPYEEWLETVTGYLKEYGICDGLVLELGCGTGVFTERMAREGYDMIGIDNSPDMLEEAMEKKEKSGLDILYLMQDMREFELYGTVRAVVSVCDSMNYILSEEDLLQVFRTVNNYLDPGGLFLFDLKTAHYFREVCGDSTMADHQEDGSCIWENTWYEEEQINEYDLTLFIREKEGLFSRKQETHYQRAYDIEKIKCLLEQAGMVFLGAYDAETGEVPDMGSERIYILAKEKGKS